MLLGGSLGSSRTQNPPVASCVGERGRNRVPQACSAARRDSASASRWLALNGSHSAALACSAPSSYGRGQSRRVRKPQLPNPSTTLLQPGVQPRSMNIGCDMCNTRPTGPTRREPRREPKSQERGPRGPHGGDCESHSWPLSGTIPLVLAYSRPFRFLNDPNAYHRGTSVCPPASIMEDDAPGTTTSSRMCRPSAPDSPPVPLLLRLPRLFAMLLWRQSGWAALTTTAATPATPAAALALSAALASRPWRRKSLKNAGRRRQSHGREAGWHGRR